MDYGHDQTDKMLKTLEKKITKEYGKAEKEVEEKFKKYLSRFEERDNKKKELLKNGKITKKDYDKWRIGQMATGKHWSDMRDILAHDFNNANKIAANMINDHAVDVYALNANYGAYEVCNGTGLDLSFELYDHDTVKRLLSENPEIIPKANIKIPKDLRWNREKLTSSVIQGILQGESIPKIAKRLYDVTDMNRKASIRNARTYTTAAENGGRIDSYQRAKSMGIDLEQEWMATLDRRTRSSHVALDGERIEVGKKFSNGCRYPGDPQGRPEEIYNCRCTLVAAIKGRDYSNDKRFSTMIDGMTYNEWKKRNELKLRYYKPLDDSFITEYFTKDDISKINKRFKMLDGLYHAKIDEISSLLQSEQEQYDIYMKNYIDRLMKENPRIRRSTAEKKAIELLGNRPTKDSIDLFEGGNFNMQTRRMTINNFSSSNEGGIEADIDKRTKRLNRWINRHGSADGFMRGNAGTTHESTFIHEYGHAIDATYNVSKDRRFKEFYKRFSKDNIASGVSEYATTNEQEFIAECFLDSFMGNTQGEISKEFMKILMEIIK